ncbi:MAG: hypothetical protein M1829_003450 [Trizodia sp. TS-e1964]|nr:MAG: hypothetical protein M1829_003450 [Trizodia sp. TS-e1964]
MIRSTPLPPITRIDERSQTRRCSKLRGIMQSSLRATIPLFAHACGVLQPLSTPDDLERFYEIYDISAADHLEMNIGFPGLEPDEEGTLKFLKMHFHRLHVTRKILFCCLLALDADGCKPDIARLGSVVPEVEKISKALGKWSEALENILGEEDFFSTPTAPKVPVTPAREKWRAQLRKLNSLSQGIRGLQAKLHILREESDKTLNESEDVTELGSNLMAQYDSIGCDLRALVHEWETSRTALALNIDKNEKRLSQSSSGLKSPALSLGGITSVDEGSPQDALNALNGFGMSARSSMDMSAEDVEMVFEAIALPRQRDRSSLTRGDRILKMKEERARVSMVRDKVEANTHMLRELESVINLRPRARTGASRITSL